MFEKILMFPPPLPVLSIGSNLSCFVFCLFVPPPPTPYLPTPQGSSKPVFLTTVSHLGVSRQLGIKVFVCLFVLNSLIIQPTFAECLSCPGCRGAYAEGEVQTAPTQGTMSEQSPERRRAASLLQVFSPPLLSAVCVYVHFFNGRSGTHAGGSHEPHVSVTGYDVTTVPVSLYCARDTHLSGKALLRD